MSSADVKAYLVGGALRNLVLSRPLGFDYDVVLDNKVMDMANLLGRRLQGSPFLLDKAHGSYRITVKRDGGIYNIDISPYNGKDILEDLNNRDFTINAMAVDINVLFRNRDVDLIDIFSGQADAENKTILEDETQTSWITGAAIGALKNNSTIIIIFLLIIIIGVLTIQNHRMKKGA